MVPTLDVVTLVKVTDGWPKVVALFETVAMEVSLLVMVTVTGASGVALRLTLIGVSRLTPVVVLPTLMFGVLTVAVRL